MKRKLHYFKAIWLLLVFLSIPAHFLHAQHNLDNQEMALFEKVVPNTAATASAGGTFLGPLTNSQRTYQMLIAASELTDLVGKNLTSVSFRLLNSASSAWPASDVTYSNYDIYLSGSVAPANRSFTFANNIVGIQTQVRSGSLLVPAGSHTSGGSPNAFGLDINFTNPWLYSGGNLLIEIRHNGSNGSSTSLDAALTTSTNYGVLYSGCWAGNYTATSTTMPANFCAVKLKGNDGLGILDFDASSYNVYPNPTSGDIQIEANTLMTRVALFNMLGQKVLEQSADSLSETVSLSHLTSGTYMLQIESELGIKNQKVIRK